MAFSTEKLKRTAYLCVICAAAVALVWLIFRYAAPVAVPFIVGWLVSLVVRPCARWVSSKTKTPYKFTAVVMLLVVMILTVFVCINGVSKLTTEAGRMLSDMIGDLETDDNIIRRSITFFDGLGKRVPWIGKIMKRDDGIGETLYRMIDNAMRTLAEKLSSGVTSAAGNIMRAMPTVLFAVISCVMTCFYLTLDSEKFKKSISPLVPAKIKDIVIKARSSVSDAIGGYVRAYLLLLAITFAELLLGLSVLRVEYSFLLAAVISLIDLLPVLGVGTVIIPWCIICLIGGDYKLAAGLAVLYGIMEVVRQLTEPHLVGKFMGIHPLVSLISVYAGFRIFGIIGMILAPIFVYIVKAVAVRKNQKDS